MRASAVPCDQCREMIDQHRSEFDLSTEAALHIAVGVLYGGWACDHVEWDHEDASQAYAALYVREIRWRDRLRVENALLRQTLRTIPGVLALSPNRIGETERKIATIVRGALEEQGATDVEAEAPNLEHESTPVAVKPRPHMSQPQAIINDAEKALYMWEDKSRVPDRFGDDIDDIRFWVNMAKIQHKQLMEVTGLAPVER